MPQRNYDSGGGEYLRHSTRKPYQTGRKSSCRIFSSIVGRAKINKIYNLPPALSKNKNYFRHTKPTNMNLSFLTTRVKSFRCATSGIIQATKTEINLRIHFAAVILVTAAGLALGLSQQEWITILLLFALIISLELINTSFEKLCDVIEPEYNNSVRLIKDIAAGAVLWASVIAVIAGIIIFAPKLLIILKQADHFI